jgi:hypothetical protein
MKRKLEYLTRKSLLPQAYAHLMEEPLLSRLLPKRPPLTRWQRFTASIHNAVLDSRIWLSKKIYYWSDDE